MYQYVYSHYVFNSNLVIQLDFIEYLIKKQGTINIQEVISNFCNQLPHGNRVKYRRLKYHQWR